jgi:hypothetical protein
VRKDSSRAAHGKKTIVTECKKDTERDIEKEWRQFIGLRAIVGLEHPILLISPSLTPASEDL